jgi:Protein of unknown function (DUF3179)
VYSRYVNGKELTFGVSGLLYKSNVLMYDHQTESLWSQIKRVAVTGPMTGTRLKVLRSALTSWKKWNRRYSGTEVLSLKTGYDRDYSRDPYEDYYESRRGLFSFFKPGPGEAEKELMVGIVVDGLQKACPLADLKKMVLVRDRVAGREVVLSFTEAVEIRDTRGLDVPQLIVYWFV